MYDFNEWNKMPTDWQPYQQPVRCQRQLCRGCRWTSGPSWRYGTARTDPVRRWCSSGRLDGLHGVGEGWETRRSVLSRESFPGTRQVRFRRGVRGSRPRFAVHVRLRIALWVAIPADLSGEIADGSGRLGGYLCPSPSPPGWPVRRRRHHRSADGRPSVVAGGNRHVPTLPTTVTAYAVGAIIVDHDGAELARDIPGERSPFRTRRTAGSAKLDGTLVWTCPVRPCTPGWNRASPAVPFTGHALELSY